VDASADEHTYAAPHGHRYADADCNRKPDPDTYRDHSDP
jgi:hypothetical protein